MNAASVESLHSNLSRTVQAALARLRDSFGDAGVPVRMRVNFSRSVDAEGRIGLEPRVEPAVDLDLLALPLHNLLETLPEADDFRAFVLTDKAINDARGEIKYRARTRVARYLEDDVGPRREIGKRLGDSYNRRSEIVHGDASKPDLSELTEQTGEILRRALQRMLESGGIGRSRGAQDLG